MSRFNKLVRSMRPMSRRALRNNRALRMNPFLHHELDDFFSPSPFFVNGRTPIFDTPLIPTVGDNSPSHKELFPSSFFTSPGYDIRELDKNKYEIQLDLPGLKASDINVELVDDASVLRIYGSRKETDKDDNVVSEAHFEKRFNVGDNVEMDKVTANLQDGVLTLVVPKHDEVEEEKVVTIPITEGSTEKEPERLESGAKADEEADEQHRALHGAARQARGDSIKKPIANE